MEDGECLRMEEADVIVLFREVNNSLKQKLLQYSVALFFLLDY